MESNLVVKTVNFSGDSLIAAKDENTGKIYTGVSYICKGIGLTKDQKDRQVKNVQSDLVLNRGCVKFDAGVLDTNNEVIGIEIDFLPLWLAKITITPTMQIEQPEVAEKLIQYQLKAKDVLADAFIKKPTCIEDVLIQSLQEMKAVRQQLNEVNHHALQAQAQSAEVKQEVQAMRDVITLNPNSWRADTTKLINAIAQQLGGFDHIKDVREESYKLLNKRYGVDVKTRLTNKRRRMADEGVCKSRRDRLTVLDVIADDKKLIEGYVAIVKEMAIKYKAA